MQRATYYVQPALAAAGAAVLGLFLCMLQLVALVKGNISIP